MVTSYLTKPLEKTEAEARAIGHTQAPWTLAPIGKTHFQFLDQDGRAVEGVLISLDSFDRYENDGEWGREIRRAHPKARAEAEFIGLAVNSHDAMRKALSELLEQIDCLGGIEFSKDLEPYKAEAVWDDAIKRAQDALALARGGKP